MLQSSKDDEISYKGYAFMSKSSIVFLAKFR